MMVLQPVTLTEVVSPSAPVVSTSKPLTQQACAPVLSAVIAPTQQMPLMLLTLRPLPLGALQTWGDS